MERAALASDTRDQESPGTPDIRPFFFAGGDVGCLLVHGFTGTPHEMRFLGERLAAQGYTVSGVCLAGHATSVKSWSAAPGPTGMRRRAPG